MAVWEKPYVHIFFQMYMCNFLVLNVHRFNMLKNSVLLEKFDFKNIFRLRTEILHKIIYVFYVQLIMFMCILSVSDFLCMWITLCLSSLCVHLCV